MGCGKFLACTVVLEIYSRGPKTTEELQIKKLAWFPDYQSLDRCRSAPGAADPKNLDEEDDDDEAFGSESTRCAFNVLIAMSSFLRGPKAVILSSVRFSGVNERNMSMSISLTTKVPINS